MSTTSAVANILPVPAAIAASKDSVTANAAKAKELYGAIGTLYSEIAADTKTIAGTTETPESILARDTGQLAMEHQVQKLSVEAGFNQDMAIDIRAIMLRDIRDTGLAVRDATQRLQEQKSVSLFDDPLEAIVNAFVIPWTEQELDGYQKRQAAAKKTLDDITGGVTNSATAEKAIQSSVTAASIANRYDALQGMLRNQQRKIGVESLQNNVQAVDFAMRADHYQTDLSFKLNQWMNEERNFNMLKQQRDIALGQHKLLLDEKKDRIAADKEFLGYVNTALTKNILPTIASVDEMNRRRQTAEGKRLFDDLYDKGRILADPRFSKTYRDGDTIEERVKFWKSTGKQARTPDEAAFAGIVMDAYNKSQSKEAKINGVEVSAEKYLDAQFNEKFGVIKKDDLINPNRAQTFVTMADRARLTTDQNFKRIFAAVILPNITDANKSISAHPELVGPMITKAVADGKIKPNDAAMFLADFYKASTNIATVNSKVFEYTGRNFTNFVTEAPVSMSATQMALGVGVGIAGVAGLFAGGAPTLSALAFGGGPASLVWNAARGNTMKTDWTDPTATGSYIIREVAAGVRFGSGLPDKTIAKPTGAPVNE